MVFGNTSIRLRDLGVEIAKKLFEWVAALPEKERSAVMGVSPMNEPAHLSWGSGEWASVQDVLEWYGEVGALFRASGLGDEGVKLYVQLIDTAFPMQNSTQEGHHAFLKVSGDWFHKTFTEAEQKSWAVMDNHWYAAWSGQECSGRAKGVTGGAYNCGDSEEKIKNILLGENCAGPWAKEFHDAFPHLKAISEFSIGTFFEADKACKDRYSLDIFLDTQVSTWNKYNIEPFFWTWRVPFGPEFEPGWSLKFILGLEKPQTDLNKVCRLPKDDKYIEPDDTTSGNSTKQME